MKSILEIFQELKSMPPNPGDSYNVSTLPGVRNHKIGISKIGGPMFFIKCEDSPKTRTLDTNLEFISVQFNRRCQLANRLNAIEENIYTIISLKAETEYLQEYFLKIVYVLLKNISGKPLLKDLKIEIEKLMNLFSRFSKPPIKTIQGLWAELLVIEQSKFPDYLILSWHSMATDKYDFNDGTDKIEVKSTSKSRRIHNFSLEQLTPNPGSRLIIASVITVETGAGASIINLLELIEARVKDKSLFFRLNEMVASTLGKDFEKSFDVYFDYQFAVDSVKYYDSINIPTINRINVPKNIMNIRFDCDITDVRDLRKIGSKSKLYNSLFRNV